jgi:hypothetical protein
VAWVGLVGFLVGLLVAFGIEYFARLHGEVKRLRDIERELENERKQRTEEHRLYERQLAIAERAAGINAVDVEVWSRAYNEARETGRFLPLPAILTRRDVLIQAKGLDEPPPS